MSRALLLVLLAVLSCASCSSESTLVGEGACEGYCFKIVGAKCKLSPTHDQCIDECLFKQGDCTREWNDYVRCTTIDATIACDSTTTMPKVVGCDKFQAAVTRSCLHQPDAGTPDAF